MDITRVNSSFRDPSGFVFVEKNTIYRQINKSYQKNFSYLLSSGLYKVLTDMQLLVSHQQVAKSIKRDDSAYSVIKPQKVPFISYPYEWCFSELKDAALATLQIQKIALEHGMTLKDASAYNIQFLNGKPILIDTLSFEKYDGGPWIAYKQFCQHFLAPLALMSYTDIRLNRLSQLYIDGVPLDLAASLLPLRSKMNVAVLIHLHIHAASQKKYADTRQVSVKKESSFTKNSMIGLIENLEGVVKKLSWHPKGTEWADYYDDNNNYSDKALINKRKIVDHFLDQINPKTVWDIGANTGFFSQVSASKNIPTVSFDIDPAAVEINYRQVKKNGESNILPLIMDFTNPSPGIGWMNKEREPLYERTIPDTILALALIHHLAISNNLPLERIAAFFAGLAKHLIIEFVPKEDSQVQKLLQTREDIFGNYNRKYFEEIFDIYFSIKEIKIVKESQRLLYLMTVKGKK